VPVAQCWIEFDIPPALVALAEKAPHEITRSASAPASRDPLPVSRTEIARLAEQAMDRPATAASDTSRSTHQRDG
jgi:hypothetical protein